MTDSQIIELFWNRSEDAIAWTDRSYGKKLRYLSQRILKSQEDSEECVSDTYMKLWNTIPPTRPQYFYAYIAAICRNLSFNVLNRNHAAKRSAELIAITDEMALCIPDPAYERSQDAKELARAMDAFLEGLPQESRILFLRRYWYMDSVAAIAKRYGMTESKVKMQLLRTRGKLKDYLRKEGIQV